MADITPVEQAVPQASLKDIASIKTQADIVSEDDFTLSPEQQAQRERLAQRSALALPIINKIIPDRTLDQHAKTVSRIYFYMNQSEDVQRDQAARRLQNEPRERSSLANRIAQTEIPEAELEEYISTVYEIAKNISPNNSGVEISDVVNLAHAIETVEQSHIFSKYATEWKAKFLSGVDDEIINTRMQDAIGIFKSFSDAGTSPKPEPRTQKEMDELFNVLLETYDIGYTLSTEEQEQRIFRSLTNGVGGVGLERRDTPQAQRVLTIFKEIINNPNRTLVENFMDHVSKYGQHHEITEDSVKGLSGKLFPAMENNDPQVDILLKGGNIWGMKKGDFGAGDFLIHCYATRVSPQNISELLLISRDVPTSNLARMEQNRLDGLSLATPFGNLRDFIHDQRPYVHDLIASMVHYYDTGDRSQLDAVIPKTDYFNSIDRIDMLYDLSLYDKVVREVRKDERVDSGMKSIDFLRRVEENTEPFPDLPPQTSDPRLNEIMQSLDENKIGGNIPKENLGQALDYANFMVQEMMASGEIGIDPNHIHALSWLERRAFEKLQSISYEDQSGAYRQDWFVSVLRFQELTCSSNDFDESKFQSFISKLQLAKTDREAYQLIGTRALESVYQLAKIQSGRGRKDTGGLWSGNLPHELIGLVDPRPAETEVGKRARNEDIKRLSEPGYHPGD